MFASGLISEKLTPEDDAKILNHNIGFTILCQRATSSISELKAEELKAGFEEVKSKIEKYKPKMISFTGKSKTHS